MNVKPEKIHVIYPGIDEGFSSSLIGSDEVARVKKEYNLPDKYILFVGQVQPRKNLTRLIKSFAALEGKYPDTKLVIVGKKGWMYDEIYSLVKELGIADRIMFTGFIHDSDLPAVYKAAMVFAFPSLYEGFGFPLVEAMKCGIPVVTSATSSLAEVAEDAALLVDPTSEKEISEALDAYLSNPNLRDDYSQRGKMRANSFTWQLCAQKTMELYHNVC